MKCHLIQHGNDGFGHQLHGLFSTMILHNIRNYFFDGQMYCKKKNFFRLHVTQQEADVLQQYLTEAVKCFCVDQKQYIPIQYKNYIHSHEIYKVPTDYKEDCLYSIDNAYYFDRIGLNAEEEKLHTKNIEKIRTYFTENNYLPKNRLKENNIVFHIRAQGKDDYDDWLGYYKEGFDEYKKKINKLMQKLKEKYPDYQIYIHSNGNVDFLKNHDFIFYGKETPLLQMLSDFIHANIFVCGCSAFSKICTFLGKHDLIIIPDNNKHSLPKKSISITDFLTEK